MGDLYAVKLADGSWWKEGPPTWFNSTSPRLALAAARQCGPTDRKLLRGARIVPVTLTEIEPKP